MDYDQTEMPEVYDAGRGYAPEVLNMWLGRIVSAVGDRPVLDILDLGCGTGRYSAALASHFQARVIALDPSERMLNEARRKPAPAVSYVRGSAEKLPIADGAVDLVFISMAFHHFDDRAQAARECYRVLRCGGILCLRAGSTEQSDHYPYVPFFPSAPRRIRQSLQSIDEVIRTFSAAGFAFLRHEVVDSVVAQDWTGFAERIAYRANSILQQLSDEEFRAGLESLRAYAEAQTASQPVVEPVDFLVLGCCSP